MANGRGLTQLLKDSKYPAVDEILFAICDRLDNELVDLADRILSGDYTKEELSDRVDEIRNMIKRDNQSE